MATYLFLSFVLVRQIYKSSKSAYIFLNGRPQLQLNIIKTAQRHLKNPIFMYQIDDKKDDRIYIFETLELISTAVMGDLH